MKVQARRLRAQGVSLNSISERLGIAKSTASLWVRDIPLTDAQRASLDSSLGTRRRLGHLTWSRQCRDRRRTAQLMGREFARLRDADYNAGCMLYWAEGSKTRNSAVIVNADAELLRMWVGWVDRWYAVPPERRVLTVNCFLGNGLVLTEIEQWWLARLGLPAVSLRKSIVNRPSSASKAVRKPLLYGTARIAIGSTFLVQSVYGAIQEIGGFDRPEWLDLQGAMQ